jgi:AbrB family looped-hinge helix DNA binding protein
MTTKGQITVPAEVRARLGLKAGTKVVFTERDDGYLVSVKGLVGSDLAGSLPKPSRSVSVEDMERGIAVGAADGAGL